jgi:uncharacterized repeat protein (TIGR03803 family)
MIGSKRKIVKLPSRQDLAQGIARGAVAALAIALFATLAASRPAFAQTESVLYNFCSLTNCADGKEPNRNIVRDSEGNIYGTTMSGGQFGQGVLYRVSPSGIETVLHDFGSTSTDGQVPYGLVADAAGNLYGTTQVGGSHIPPFQTVGGGTLFKMTPAGVYSTLYNFAATRADAEYPLAGPTLDSKGNTYGTTAYGGAYGNGTVYKIGPNGHETILHSFNNNGVDGYIPSTEVAFDKNGNLWGTCTYGGHRGYGIIFEVSASGVYSIRLNFGWTVSNAGYPVAGLTVDTAGNLYGLALSYTLSSLGAVYEVTRDTSGKWIETNLIDFSSSGGNSPEAGVTFDSAGNLYGTTFQGGTLGYGTVYELTPGGELTTLYNFDSTHGSGPNTNLLLDSAGNLYGTTPNGGSGNTGNGGGVLYEISR